MTVVDPSPSPWRSPDASSRAVFAATLRIDITQEDGRTVLQLTGELDMASAPTFSRELSQALERSPATIVDMTTLDFIDSSGLRSLVLGTQRASALEHSLRLLRPSEELFRVITMSGLDSLLPLE